MTTPRVETANEIMLNGLRYPIISPILVGSVPSYAPKVIIGDTNKDTHEGVSVITWRDWRGGIGIDVMDGVKEINRSWYSEWRTRHKGNLVLPPLATLTAVSGEPGTFDVGAINEYNSVIYAAFGLTVYSYSNSADTWASSRTLANVATDAINVFLGGTEYLVVAQTSDYDYYNGTVWARSTKNAKYLAFWDDRLWGIDNDGQLWWALAPGTETNDAALPLPAGVVTNLFVGRGTDDEEILYAVTTRGLYSHDLANRRFVRVSSLALPTHPDTGLGADAWRDSLYISSGLPVHRLIQGANTAAVTVMGPDQDDGLPSNRRGRIRALLTSVNDLIALIDSTTAPGSVTIHQSQAPGNGDVSPGDSGYSHILGWDELGWESKWVSSDATRALTAGHVSNAYSSYRLWFGHNQRVYWMSLPRDITNPTQLTDQTYDAGPRIHQTPWVGLGQPNLQKLALRLSVEVTGASATETVIVAYTLNRSSSFTTLGTITSDGVTTYEFPSSATPTGTAFNTIRFQFTGARGSTTTSSPDIREVEFQFSVKLPNRKAFQVTVDLSRDEYGGQSREQMYENLEATIASNLKVEFTYRNRTADDAGNADPYNYFVNVTTDSGQDKTGVDWTGKKTLTLVER